MKPNPNSSQMPPIMADKLQTVQLAGSIFLDVVKADVKQKPEDAVRKAFAFAEAFDNRAQEFLKPSPILQKPVSTLVT